MSVTSRKPRSTRGSCAECTYWIEGTDVGQCRRHAPQIVAGQMAVPTALLRELDLYQPNFGVFPLTAKDDWCGEYLRK